MEGPFGFLVRGHLGLVAQDLLAQMPLPLKVLLALLRDLGRVALSFLLYLLSHLLDQASLSFALLIRILCATSLI